MNIFTLFLTQPLANGLALAYKLLGHNMGLAIIGFSLALRIALNPLTKPYLASMKKMKEYSQDLEKLRHRHKNDKTKLLQAQAEFYRQKGINPSAGCLPYLLQIIVLIALFRVFTSVLSANGDLVEKFNTLLYQPLKFSSTEVINTKFLYLDVTKPDVFRLPSVPFPLPGPVVILSAAIQFLSTKFSSQYVKTERKLAKKTPEQSDDIMVATQSSMLYLFPLLTLWIGIQFPSGLALYWILFSLFQLLQQSSFSVKEAGSWLKKLSLLKLPHLK